MAQDVGMGVKLLWCHSHLVWLVFEGSIPTCACFHSENFFVTLLYAHNSLSFCPVMPTVNSSTANITVRDRDVGPLLVVPSGEDVTLFAVVTADPCPTIHWKLNGSTTIRQSDVYTIGNPCHPDGLNSAFYNFTITINVTTETAGYYTAQFNNVAGVADVPAVFVTPPGMPTVQFVEH